jgi:hypothetical protein
VPYDLTMGNDIVPPTKENLSRYMANVLEVARKHEDSFCFREPVNADDVPDYYSVVSDPMDLQTMQVRSVVTGVNIGNLKKYADITDGMLLSFQIISGTFLLRALQSLFD